MHKLHLHATTLCPNYCRHCSVEAGPVGQSFLQKADFQYLVDWARAAGAQWLEISGGEPLTLGDALLELVAYAHAAGLYVSLLSNGGMITAPVSRRLRAVGLERLGVSLYGATSRTHDDFTQRPGSFSRAELGIHAAAADLEVIVNVVVTPQNVAEIPLLPSQFPDVDLYTLGSVVPAGRGATLTGYAFSEDEYRPAIDRLTRAFSETPSLFLNSLSPMPSTEVDRYCVRPSIETTVTHDGHRIPCCLLPRRLQHPVGDVSHRSFHAVPDDDVVFYWLEQGHRALREYLQYAEGSHNLCKTCIAMLDVVTQRRHAIP